MNTTTDLTPEQERKKLLIDAENILTWEPPSDGDLLGFGHLRRFAKATIALLTELDAVRRDRCRVCGGKIVEQDGSLFCFQTDPPHHEPTLTGAAVRRLPFSHPQHQALALAVLRLEADMARWSGFLKLDPDSPSTIGPDLLAEIVKFNEHVVDAYMGMLAYRRALNSENGR